MCKSKNWRDRDEIVPRCLVAICAEEKRRRKAQDKTVQRRGRKARLYEMRGDWQACDNFLTVPGLQVDWRLAKHFTTKNRSGVARPMHDLLAMYCWYEWEDVGAVSRMFWLRQSEAGKEGAQPLGRKVQLHEIRET